MSKNLTYCIAQIKKHSLILNLATFALTLATISFWAIPSIPKDFEFSLIFGLIAVVLPVAIPASLYQLKNLAVEESLYPIAQLKEKGYTYPDVVTDINNDFASSKSVSIGYAYPKYFIGSRWIIQLGMFNFRIFRIDDLVWVFRRTQTTIVIGSPLLMSSDQGIVIFTHEGREIPLNAQPEDIDLVFHHLQKAAPWLLVGYSRELADSWSKNKQAVIAEVKNRRLVAEQANSPVDGVKSHTSLNPIDYEQFVATIKQSLSGEWQHDYQLLNQQIEKYRNHAQGKELVKALVRLQVEILPYHVHKEVCAPIVELEETLKATLAATKQRIDEGNIDGAEALLLSEGLGEGLPDQLFAEDGEAVYLEFPSQLEREYFKIKNSPKKVLRQPGLFPWLSSYQLAAYVAFERQNFDLTLKIIEKGLRRCPLATDLLFERAEVYKVTGQWENFRLATESIAPTIYRRHDIAHYFRNMGYYFIEQKLWQAAYCCYRASLAWQPTELAEHQIGYIVQTSKIPSDTFRDLGRDPELCNQTLLNHNVSPQPVDRLWLQLAHHLGDASQQIADFQSAEHYFSLYYELTGDPEVEARLKECRSNLLPERATAYLRTDGILRIMRYARIDGYTRYAAKNLSPSMAGYAETIQTLNLAAGQTKEMSAWYNAPQTTSLLREFDLFAFDPKTGQFWVAERGKYAYFTADGISTISVENDEVGEMGRFSAGYLVATRNNFADSAELVDAYQSDVSKLSDSVKERLMLFVKPRPGVREDLTAFLISFICITKPDPNDKDPELKSLLRVHLPRTIQIVERYSSSLWEEHKQDVCNAK